MSDLVAPASRPVARPGHTLLELILALGLAMLVVTMPVVFPIITGLGFDPIWFGVICVIVIEMGLITPPVGINVFVVKGVASGVPMATIFRGVLPFWFAMAACLLLLILFPEIALYLPSQMK